MDEKSPHRGESSPFLFFHLFLTKSRVADFCWFSKLHFTTVPSSFDPRVVSQHMVVLLSLIEVISISFETALILHVY